MRKMVLVLLCLVFLVPVGVYASEETNKVRIVSNTYDYKPLLGFKYELTNNDTGEKHSIDLTETEETSLELEDGRYTLVEVERPEGYSEVKEFTFELPYKEDNISSREIAVYPKHKVMETVPTSSVVESTQKSGKRQSGIVKTGESGSLAWLSALFLASGVCLFALRRFGGKEEDET